MTTTPTSRVPWWFKAIVIALMLPLALYPSALSQLPAGTDIGWIARLYPAYAAVSGICAWIVYRQRPEVAWILVALLALSHAGMYALLKQMA